MESSESKVSKVQIFSRETAGKILFTCLYILVLSALLQINPQPYWSRGIECFFKYQFKPGTCMDVILAVWSLSTIIISWLVSNVDNRHCGIRSIDLLIIRFGRTLLCKYAAAAVAELALAVISALFEWDFILLACLISMGLLMICCLAVLIFSHMWDRIEHVVNENSLEILSHPDLIGSEGHELNFEKVKDSKWLMASMVQNMDYTSGNEVSRLIAALQHIWSEDAAGENRKRQLYEPLKCGGNITCAYYFAYVLIFLLSYYCSDADCLTLIMKKWIGRIMEIRIRHDGIIYSSKLKRELLRGSILAMDDAAKCYKSCEVISTLYVSMGKSDPEERKYGSYIAGCYLANSSYLAAKPGQYANYYCARDFYLLNKDSLSDAGTEQLAEAIWCLYYAGREGRENLDMILSSGEDA